MKKGRGRREVPDGGGQNMKESEGRDGRSLREGAERRKYIGWREGRKEVVGRR